MSRRMGFLGIGMGIALWLAPGAEAATDEQIQRAIQRGVEALKTRPIGDNVRGHHQLGAQALKGLTLLECGVAPTDPAIEQAAKDVREASIELTHTYTLALSLLFLDRLGDPRDVPLIQSMGARLLAGQNQTGGWTYYCPRIEDSEVRRLTNVVRQRNELVGARELPRIAPYDPRKPPELPAEIKRQLQLINQQQAVRRAGGPGGFMGGGDNSNTQFAILGVWVARRHGLPVHDALNRLDARFRGSQNADGGWSYTSMSSGMGINMPSTAAMTCAGLLGLALHHGSVNEAVLRTNATPNATPVKPTRDPSQDPAVRAGLMALATTIGDPGDAGNLRGPRRMRQGYYFLWSVERVAVAYSLDTIGKKDWYAWGADILVRGQNLDGTWDGEYGPDIDTPFALLFLRRVNLARDLTASLKGKVQDPGEITLKAGGVGGAGLLGKGLQGGIGFGDSAGNGGPAAGQSLDGEIAYLRDELLNADNAEQPRLLDQFKDGKGSVYTQALAAAIPKMPAAGRAPARQALAERLTRMTADTLRAQLRDGDEEVRRAAALACAMKDDARHVPDLIAALKDDSPMVVWAARIALKNLTEQDFGPTPNASPADRARAHAAWQAWYDKAGKKE
ncbi:MAG: HEAT repeat domain-containing protein [Gemmataceae bacterium]